MSYFGKNAGAGFQKIVLQKSSIFNSNRNQSIEAFYSWSQPAITCSRLTIKTLEQGVKYVQSLDTRTVLVSLLLSLNLFHPLLQYFYC